MPISLVITPLTAALDVGDTLQLTISPNPHGVKFSCDNCQVASVSSQGLITALAEGEATITAKRGNSTVTITVTVTDVPLPEEPPAPPVVQLNAVGGSTVADTWTFSTEGTAAAAGDVIVSSQIDFGDGSAPTIYPGAPPEEITKTWALIGTYTVTLSVLTQLGQSGSVALPVEVLDVPSPPDPEQPPLASPVATLIFVSGQYTNQPITFTASGHDPDGTVVSHSFVWGDGSDETAAGPPPSTKTHSYTAPGTYTVQLILTDNDGRIGTAELTVTIVNQPTVNQPPIAVLQLLSGSFAGDGFTFSTIGTTDPDGTIASWLFQSGTSGTGSQQSGAGAPPTSIIATYPTVGTFTARLTVTDNNGATAQRNLSVTVVAAPQPGNYPYFDSLVARPDRLFVWALRSTAEIAQYARPANGFEIPTTYDASVDACLFQIDPTRGGVDGTANEPSQVWLPLAIAFGTTFLLTFDQLWSAGWAYLGVGYVPRYKTLRFDCNNGAEASTWGTLKHHFDEGPAASGLLRYKYEVGTAHPYVLPPTQEVSEVVQPQTFFTMQASRWVRTWVYYNAANQLLSQWTADSVQGIVQQMNQNKWGFPSTGLRRWRLEFDTSADSTPALNPLSKAWIRNVVVLQGLSYAQAQALLSTQGL